MLFYVIVTCNQYEEHVVKTGYDIEAPNCHDAEEEAKERYAKEWGFKREFMTAYTLNKHLKK